MKQLLYVPVIHEEADLGSVAASARKKSQEFFGKARWARHKEIVTLFWDRLSGYFSELDPTGLRIYQDGLAAGGELGRRIIEEGAARGSRNYQIVLDLIRRGGEIQKTEDIEILKKELERILQCIQNDSSDKKDSISAENPLKGDRLMEERDRFVAKTIGDTLKEGEQGILFMGAFHRVIGYLPEVIEVREVKNVQKVRDYFTLLISDNDKEEFERLSGYMVSPVSSGESSFSSYSPATI